VAHSETVSRLLGFARKYRRSPVEQRLDALGEFQGLFEEIVHLLCDGARSPEGGLDEKRYEWLRTEAILAYRPISKYITAFFPYSPGSSDDDPFEALLSCATLEKTITHGDAIDWANRCQKALELYREHLNHLSAAR
jgi:hypothetical protein